MRDKSVVLAALVNCQTASDQEAQALSQFERQYRDEPWVMNLWRKIRQLTVNRVGLVG